MLTSLGAGVNFENINLSYKYPNMSSILRGNEDLKNFLN
jgi:hypothetical protein